MNTNKFTYKDLTIIYMALLDKACLNSTPSYERDKCYDISETLFDHTELSRGDLRLICDSLRSYYVRYEYELYESKECKRVYSKILREMR